MNTHPAPFPQANDINKVIKIINIDHEDNLKDYGYMCMYLGDISNRQVDYYISACTYLNLIGTNKEFTDLGLILRGLTGVEQSVRLAQIIVSDIVFGEVYFMQKFLGIDMTVEDVAERMKKYVVFDSEAMYLRRSSTVCSWIKWILRQEEQSGNEY